MKKIYTLLSLVGLLAMSTQSIAQCANDNVQFGTSLAPTVPNAVTTLSTCMFGGEYRLVNNMVAGSTYTFETCGDTDFDSQITVFNAVTGALIAYNDDACGLQSRVTFVSTGVSVRVSIDRYFCTNQSSCMTLNAILLGAAQPSPCTNITALAGCGASGSFSLSGTGSFTGMGPFQTPGKERIYSFTAPFSGGYEITISHTGGYYVDLFTRTATSGCGPTGWTYVDDILGSATNTVNLVGGTTYYFLVDDEDTNLSSGTISIECPCIPSNTPDASYIYDGPFTIAGNTIDECSDCSLRPSEDQIYAVEILCAGSYTFQTCGGANWDTYLYLTTAFCGGTTLASNDDFSCNGGFTLQSSVTANLTPGVYYIQVEAFSATGGGAFNLAVSGNLTPIQLAVTSSTDVSCFGGSDGSATAVALTGTNPFSFEWDDAAAQTTATASGLSAGTYSVGGKDANGCVANPVSVTINQPTLLVGSASSTVIPCFGGTSDVTVVASGGTPPYSGEGVYTVSAGTHSFAVTDANGCSAVATIIVTQPDQIEANITPQNHVIDCIPIPVDLYANPTGGTGGPYTYLWSTGATTASISVNPNVTTTYSVAITDANGCTENVTTNSTTVTVINRCGINNQKVLLCHVPAGKPNNAQTICVSPNALNPHLSSLWNLHGGDYCGPCATSSALITTGDMNLGDNTFIRAGANINTEMVEISFRLGYDSDVKVEIYDMAGVLVDVLYEGKAVEGELVEMNVQSNKMSSGVYIYQFITDHETHIDKLQIIQ